VLPFDSFQSEVRIYSRGVASIAIVAPTKLSKSYLVHITKIVEAVWATTTNQTTTSCHFFGRTIVVAGQRGYRY